MPFDLSQDQQRARGDIFVDIPKTAYCVVSLALDEKLRTIDYLRYAYSDRGDHVHLLYVHKDRYPRVGPSTIDFSHLNREKVDQAIQGKRKPWKEQLQDLVGMETIEEPVTDVRKAALDVTDELAKAAGEAMLDPMAKAALHVNMVPQAEKLPETLRFGITETGTLEELIEATRQRVVADGEESIQLFRRLLAELGEKLAK